MLIKLQLLAFPCIFSFVIFRFFPPASGSRRENNAYPDPQPWSWGVKPPDNAWCSYHRAIPILFF